MIAASLDVAADASLSSHSPAGWLKRAEDEVKAERVRWFVSDFRKALEVVPKLRVRFLV